MERLISDLHFINSAKAIDTVEVDLGSLTKSCHDYLDVVIESLQPLAESSPNLRATVYVQQMPSANFMQPGCSVFIGVVGNSNALELILDGFQSTKGVDARYGDSILAKQSSRRLHIEDGSVWRQEDDSTWFVDSGLNQYEESSELEDDDYQYTDEDYAKYPSNAKVYEAGDLLKNKGKVDATELDVIKCTDDTTQSRAIYTRQRATRSDASVGSIRSTIEEVFGLPEGSVRLCDPEGYSLRADAKIATLRKRWDNG
ncbi:MULTISPECIES: hypothetical protein [unclassified Vibrio]|uniref:hypothetical protein n=1 Tax=unclassified Vibrio TaxID=2614977 RepID=UPI00159DB686|nr:MULTISPECIES: hypothetical protein [unclassified Vibrio]NVN80042.1 hypothetical protein [Vibrio sp. Scap16]QLE94569.1 hypothetical protein FLM53_16210 [Vibrio sp. Scap24]